MDVDGFGFYRSDGSGVVLLSRGPSATSAQRLTAAGGALYFVANGSSGSEPWRSDGTSAGTVQLADVRPGTSGSFPEGFVSVGPVVYFQANDGTTGEELWRTDGTEAGTVLVQDIRAGSQSSTPTFLIAVGQTLFFRARTDAEGFELWKVEDANLPVELTAFTATLDGDVAQLDWQTASETNSDGFSVEMNDSGPDWQSLGWVEGAGTTLEAQSYAFRTDALNPGTYRFRLRQIDLDGSEEFSPVVELSIVERDALALSLSGPSPFRDRSSVTLAVGRSQSVRVALFDALGRELAVLHHGPVEDPVELSIPGGGLASGIYVVRAEGEFGTASHVIVRSR